MVCSASGERVAVGRREDGLSANAVRDRALRGAMLVRDRAADALIYIAINGPAFPVALFAAGYAQVPLVPLNYRIGREQLSNLIARHPNALVIADAAEPDSLPGKARWMTTKRWLEETAAPATDPGIGAQFEASSNPESLAAVIYTSGTTSSPKGVLLRGRNLVSYVINTTDFLNAEVDDASLVCVPPYHIAGLMSVLTNVYAGRRILMLEQFTPEAWFDLVRSEGVSNAFVVPTMLQRLVSGDGDKSVPSLKSLAYGGSPMKRSTIEKALRLWPEVDFVNAYGLTETSSTVAILGPDDHRAALHSENEVVRARLGSVGRVLPGIELQIRDDDGAALEPGNVGRIFLRAEQISAGYAETGWAGDDRGFFDTRDNGYVDADGFLFICGRSDDTIIRGGENIAPAEIEEVVCRHPAVTDAAVVGVPDEEWGERIVAVVVLASGVEVSEGELREFARASLRSSKTPERFFYWPELPRTETGKLIRREVARKLGSRTSAPSP